MAGYIWEFFGHRADDRSAKSLDSATNEKCPFIADKCVKTLNDGLMAGACSIAPMRSKAVICCPIRLYADDYQILKDVSFDAFGEKFSLVSGPKAVREARSSGEPRVAVFGKRWGGELRVPKKDGKGSFWVDWILALIDPQGRLVEFVATEVQSIDTTGNYRFGRSELLAGKREHIKTTAGLNWENVNKRILPQLIYKGQLLQREPFCKKGLYFVSPQQVYEEIVRRVGGLNALPKYRNLQPASISFLAYDHDLAAASTDGMTVPLEQTSHHRTTIEMLTRAFNTVTLTEENVYRDAILEGLGLDRATPEKYVV